MNIFSGLSNIWETSLSWY